MDDQFRNQILSEDEPRFNAGREIFCRRILDEEIILVPIQGWPLFTDIRTVNIFPRRLEINQTPNGPS